MFSENIGCPESFDSDEAAETEFDAHDARMTVAAKMIAGRFFFIDFPYL